MALATTTLAWYRPSWQRQAACRGQAAAPGLNWFPQAGESAEAAKAVCAGCPVRVECLDYARSAGITDGIWAGTTPEERPVPQRQRQPPGRRPMPASTECPHGHPFDEENTSYTRAGKRRCRACARESERRRRAATKAA